MFRLLVTLSTNPNEPTGIVLKKSRQPKNTVSHRGELDFRRNKIAFVAIRFNGKEKSNKIRALFRTRSLFLSLTRSLSSFLCVWIDFI